MYKKKILIIMMMAVMCPLSYAGAQPAATGGYVETGISKMKATGLLQFWYQHDRSAAPTDTFRLRRAEIKLTGDIKPEVSWAVMIDPAQVREDDAVSGNIVGQTGSTTTAITSVGRKSPLQDFLVTLKPHKSCSVDFGQYKVPFGMEGLEPSAKLDFVERSAMATQFKWADYRDIGVTVKGDFDAGGVKIQPALGLFNGEGQGKLDANEPMAFVGRLAVKPVKQLHLGFAHYNGQSASAKTANFRTGMELKYDADPVLIFGEYMTGKSANKSKQTYYLAAGYKLSPKLQSMVRYDYWDSDKKAASNANTETTAGLNYFIENHNSKVQLNYSFKNEEGTSVNNDTLRLNVQVSY